MAKYLIIRFSSIGDIVLTSPVIRCLRKTHPDSEIHFITKKEYGSIVENNPYVDKVITIEKEIDEVVDELKIESYDFLIDLHNNLRSVRLKKKLNRPSASFPKLNFKKFILTNFKVNTLPNVHVVDRYFKAVESLGVKSDGKGLDYFIPDGTQISEFNLPENYVAYSIGAQYNTKKLPIEKMIELIEKIESPVVLLGGNGDVENGKSIKSSCPQAIDLTGKLSLDQSALVVKKAEKVIAHDTGLMHIASAFNKKIISIWGNTIPDLGMYPYMPENSNLYSIHEVDIKCRPCSKIGYQECPKKHFRCMNDQDLNKISSEANT